MHDLSRHPSHRVDIKNLVSHATVCDSPCAGDFLQQGQLSQTPYRVSDLGVGDQVYIDRPYIFHQLPPFMHGLNAIQTSNSDDSVQSSADDAEWFCFDVEEPVRIFLLYDPIILQTNTPAWVAASFTDQHEETGLTDHYYGETGVNADRTVQGMGNNYEILSGTFPAGHICLGGNGCTAAEDAQHDCA